MKQMLDVVATTPSRPLGACRLVMVDMGPRLRGVTNLFCVTNLCDESCVANLCVANLVPGTHKIVQGNPLLYAKAGVVSKVGWPEAWAQRKIRGLSIARRKINSGSRHLYPRRMK